MPPANVLMAIGGETKLEFTVDASGNGSHDLDGASSDLLGWAVDHTKGVVAAAGGTITIKNKNSGEILVDAVRIDREFHRFSILPKEIVIPAVPATPGDSEADPPVAPTPEIPAINTGIYMIDPIPALEVMLTGVDPLPANNEVGVFIFKYVH